MAKLYKVRKKCLICGGVFYPKYAGSLYCENCKNKKSSPAPKPVKPKSVKKVKVAKARQAKKLSVYFYLKWGKNIFFFHS